MKEARREIERRGERGKGGEIDRKLVREIGRGEEKEIERGEEREIERGEERLKEGERD